MSPLRAGGAFGFVRGVRRDVTALAPIAKHTVVVMVDVVHVLELVPASAAPSPAWFTTGRQAARRRSLWRRPPPAGSHLTRLMIETTLALSAKSSPSHSFTRDDVAVRPNGVLLRRRDVLGRRRPAAYTNMANDHYISRFMTRPWEGGDRKLHFYDFDARKFGRKTSKHLFAAEGLNVRATEEMLNKVIETPLARYLDATVGRDPGAVLVNPGSWSHYRALATLWLLQVVRLRDAGARNDHESLDDVLRKGEGLLDQYAAALRETRRVIGVTLPQREILSFPRNAYFPIPMMGEPPVAALPLSPRHFFAVVDKTFSESQLEERIATPGLVTSLSVGTGPLATLTVIPVEHHQRLQDDPADYEKYLLAQRESAHAIFNQMGEESVARGLRGFAVSEQSS